MVRALLRLTPALIAFGLFLEACDKVEVVAPDPPRVSISPAAITITAPFPLRPCVRARVKAFVIADDGVPPPQLLLSTSAPLRHDQSMAR